MTSYSGLSPRTILAATIAGALLGGEVSGETLFCAVQANGNLNCDASGSYQNPVVIEPVSGSVSTIPPMYATTSMDIVATVSSQMQAGLFFAAIGADGGSSGGATLDGYDAEGLTITNGGSVMLTGASQATGLPLYGVLAQLAGGPAVTASDGDTGGNGGNAGTQEILYLTNNASINMSDLSDIAIRGGAGVAALSQGGNGAATSGDHNPSGAGGYASGTRLKQSGDVAVRVQGAERFAGLLAVSEGGQGGNQYDGGSNPGGAAGGAVLQNSGQVVVDWTWFDADMSSDNTALYGILAEALGGTGGDSTSDGLGNGGTGGLANSVAVTLETGAAVNVIQRGAPPNVSGGVVTLPGAGVAALLLGGNGGNGLADEDHTRGGDGGDAGVIGAQTPALQMVATDTSVSTSGDPDASNSSPSGDKLPALFMWGQGGAGAGIFNDSVRYSLRTAGNGGNVGDASLTVNAQTLPVTLSTNGDDASGIQTMQQGGTGGNGAQYNGDGIGIGDTDPPGNAGAGGNAGGMTIALAGAAALPVTIRTTGDASHGLYASLQGGAGGTGGIYDVNLGGQPGGTGGAGGSTGQMWVTLQNTSIMTAGVEAFGILAQSRGANGGWGGDATGTGVVGGPGGAGGSTENVRVSLDAASRITTQGSRAIGIVAQTASGAGGGGGQANGVGSGVGGNGGAGGTSGTVTVNNAGLITTSGVDAIGILAQSVAGAGGSGAASYGILDSTGGVGGTAGVSGNIAVTHGGSISTGGDAALGIVAQSIGGSGGSGGTASGLIVSLGGDSSTNPLRSDGSQVNIYGSASGSVTTAGTSAVGILAQSIGGGGGVGGGSEGAVSVGATGGEGGSGSVIDAELSSFSIATQGNNAYGLVAQSIGGGGGNAGNASSAGVFASLALGQTAGSGGDGGPVIANLANTNITTQGSKAAGLVAQSIGGGGGTGGRAFAGAVGVGYAGAVAVGGQGGTGGAGGNISSELIGGSIATGQTPALTNGCGSAACTSSGALPVDAFGALVQSIGGGGGLGGNASASAVASGINLDENTQVSLAIAVSLGGQGGIAGDGGYTTFTVSDGAQINTAGQGSHGVLIQSIGGGGGAGGDSSSMAASVGSPGATTSLSLDGSFALGAGGGAGGHGGSVWTALGGVVNVVNGSATFTADSSATPASTIATYGDYANGITAQSIGGGGGNAGFGSATTQSFGTGTNLSPSISLGGTGGGGGAGGLVQVEVMTRGSVQTWGSGAIGVLAQSIGGGGGASQGGSFTLSGTSSAFSGGMTLNLGNDGAEGNIGGPVDVTVAGTIVTYGGDSPAVQAQSIGGGGGHGGSAGSDGSFDNPVVQAEHARTAVSGVAAQLASILQDEPGESTRAYHTSVSIGGTGGVGNTGGTVGVILNAGAALQTAGDWSTGILAQSIGGGGGKGGNALATGTAWVNPAKLQVNAVFALGAKGGIGGDGGAVTTTLDGAAISTSGFGAAGILAQSIGGGGGHGADGSDGYAGTVTLGMSAGESGGSGGGGGVITLDTGNNATTITTSGEAAWGIVLQSVGGGGGFAGVGSSVTADVGNIDLPSVSLGILSAANQRGSDGGAVTLTDNAGLRMTTLGNNAFGIVAQSVGGGGGVVINSQNQQVSTGISASIRGAAYDSSEGLGTNGGTVKVDLSAQSIIRTSGTGAHGVIAQSIGGGGGIVGLPGNAATLSVDESLATATAAGVGLGGNVSVTVNGSVAVSGVGAVGILAQSVTGAGGLVLADDGQTVYAGAAVAGGLSGDVSTSTVDVTVNAESNVTSTGDNGIGIFAQNVASEYGATVTVEGSVSGGPSGSNAAAIWIEGTQTGTLTIGSGGTVQGRDGLAIRATSSALRVTNNGQVQGSVTLNGGSMSNDGQYMAGTVFEGELLNRGRFILGGTQGLWAGLDRTRYMSTSLTGSLMQTASGITQIGADFNEQISDAIIINGSAQLDGQLSVVPRTLLPNRELPILTVNGGMLSGAWQAQDSPIFDYDARRFDREIRLRVAAADFNARDMGLEGNRHTVASHLQHGWDHGGSSALATLYAVLDAASRSGVADYQQRISDLSPGVTLAPAAQIQLGMVRFTNAMMSCPAFDDVGVAVAERECFWGDVSVRHTNQKGGNTTSGFSFDNATYQFGGQRELAPHWFIGGSVAYQSTHVRGDDGRVSGSGGAGYAGIVLKREVDAWTFSTALGGGYGTFDLDRNLNIAGYANQATGRPDVYSLSLRTRASRTYAKDDFYIKPYVDISATYSRMPAYRESGDALRLTVASSDQFVIGLAPSIEFGGWIGLSGGTTMRPFAYGGVSLLTSDGWKTRSRLAGAPDGSGQFVTALPTDTVIGRVGAGMQIANRGGMDMRLQYDGEFASHGNSHSGSLKVMMPF